VAIIPKKPAKFPMISFVSPLGASLFGFVFSWLFLLTGSFWVSVLAHSLVKGETRWNSLPPSLLVPSPEVVELVPGVGGTS